MHGKGRMSLRRWKLGSGINYSLLTGAMRLTMTGTISGGSYVRGACVFLCKAFAKQE